MDKVLPKNENRIITYYDKRSPYYSVQQVALPLKESHLIQLGRGEHEVALQMATVGKIGMVRNGFAVESVGVNVVHPDYVAIAIPETWSGDFLINGQTANESAFFMTGDLDSFHFHSKSRVTLGVTLPRQPFTEAIGALAGVYAEDIRLNQQRFQLSEMESHAFKSRLHSIIAKTCNHPGNTIGHYFQAAISNEVTDLLADAYLRALPGSRFQAARIKHPKRIVRLAEERFMAAHGTPISLADLCLAAGVSKSSLYQAFQSVCGIPPLLYFHKRRLLQARTLLLLDDDIRGGVKRAALTCGFTELGRFSAQYQQLFGELPSATLRRTYSCRLP